MALYPLDLVLAAALAWGTIFFGALPTHLIHAPVFTRPVGFAGLGWMVVAAVSPAAILHYYIFLGLLCLFAWWKLRRDEALGGKMWLAVASGLGIGLGLVLILAVTPVAYSSGLARWNQIGSIYLGGAVIGLGAVLFLFTRREATRSDIPVGWVLHYGRLLFILALARAVWGILFVIYFSPRGALLAAGCWLILPVLGGLAWRQVRSPAPSTSGPPLLILCLAGLIAEILIR